MANHFYTNWVSRCLSTGLNAYSFKDGLRPFLLTDVNGKIERSHFAAGTDEDALNQVREAVSKLSVDTRAYGIIWFQTLTAHGFSGPTILVEAACRSDQYAQVWARRFSASGPLSKLLSSPTSIFFGVRLANALSQPTCSQDTKYGNQQ